MQKRKLYATTYSSILKQMDGSEQNPIPWPQSASEMDVIEVRKMGSQLQAQQLFEQASIKLLSVNRWGSFGGIAGFKLFDRQGEHVIRKAIEGDFIRIDSNLEHTVPGSFDWVQILKIFHQNEDDIQQVAIWIRSCPNPLTGKPESAKLLADQVASTFVIKRDRVCIWAKENSRNEKPKVHPELMLNRPENHLANLAGKLKLFHPQWKFLVKGLLDGKP